MIMVIPPRKPPMASAVTARISGTNTLIEDVSPYVLQLDD
jgi:hypothetical protein